MRAQIPTPRLTVHPNLPIIYLFRQAAKTASHTRGGAVNIFKDTSTGRGRRMWWRGDRKRQPTGVKVALVLHVQRTMSTVINTHICMCAIRQPRDINRTCQLLKPPVNINSQCFPKLSSTPKMSKHNSNVCQLHCRDGSLLQELIIDLIMNI